jgi:hypothetical protein
MLQAIRDRTGGSRQRDTSPAGRAAENTATGKAPLSMFVVQATYLLLLLAVFVVYETSPGFRMSLPTSLGNLPVEVPWFGALGGSLISLDGIFRHQCEWNPCYQYWHYSRPLIGAVIGSLGALIFLQISGTATDGATTLNPTAFDVVAFLVGYREQSFRDLIKRATDLLLKPPSPSGTDTAANGGQALAPATPASKADAGSPQGAATPAQLGPPAAGSQPPAVSPPPEDGSDAPKT